MTEEQLNEEQVKAPEVVETEKTAAPREDGPKHQTEAEWAEAGHDPADYKSEKVFNEIGEWRDKNIEIQNRMDDMQRNFNDQVTGLNQLHKLQADQERTNLNTQIQTLTVQRDAAIADFNQEGVTTAQGQIDALYNARDQQQAPPVQQQQPDRDPALARFEQDNPWVMTPGPKQSFANAQLDHYTQRGISMTEALNMVSKDMQRTFPEVNPNRDTAPSAERGSKPGGKQQSRALTMSDLTADEAKQYRPEMWNNEAQFLKAVTNSRKGE